MAMRWWCDLARAFESDAPVGAELFGGGFVAGILPEVGGEAEE